MTEAEHGSFEWYLADLSDGGVLSPTEIRYAKENWEADQETCIRDTEENIARREKRAADTLAFEASDPGFREWRGANPQRDHADYLRHLERQAEVAAQEAEPAFQAYRADHPGAAYWEFERAQRQAPPAIEPEDEEEEAEQASRVDTHKPRKGALAQSVAARFKTEHPPPKDRPFWIVLDSGSTQAKRSELRGRKLRLWEWEWMGTSFRRTAAPPILNPTLDQALNLAEWWGRLPKMGRRKRAFTRENLEKATPLFAGNKSDREVARRLGVGHEVASQLRTAWQNAG